jgi:hypothetical protein
MTHNDRRVCEVGVLKNLINMTTEEINMHIASHEKMIDILRFNSRTSSSNWERNVYAGTIDYHFRRIQLLKDELSFLNKPTEAITEAAHFANTMCSLHNSHLVYKDICFTLYKNSNLKLCKAKNNSVKNCLLIFN